MSCFRRDFKRDPRTEMKFGAVQASIEEALARLNESNETAQKISKERRAIQVLIDHLPFEFPK